MYTGGLACGPCARRPAATMASSPGGWSVCTPTPTRLCLTTCVPGGPGLPTGNAATSPRVKTVCSNPKGHSANSPQGTGCRGKSLGLSLHTGHWIGFPKDCELGPELSIFHWGAWVCTRMCVYMRDCKRWQGVPHRLPRSPL